MIKIPAEAIIFVFLMCASVAMFFFGRNVGYRAAVQEVEQLQEEFGNAVRQAMESAVHVDDNNVDCILRAIELNRDTTDCGTVPTERSNPGSPPDGTENQYP